jgi:3-hydroxybutyryl-CoA dehydratase
MVVISFHIGQTHNIETAIMPADVARFAELSGDRAPLHTDASFAKDAGFEGPVVHGAYLVALVSRLVGMEFPGTGAVLERIDLAFRKPCYAPQDVVLTATVKQISEAVATVMLEITISDRVGSVLASGRTWHRILSKPAS